MIGRIPTERGAEEKMADIQIVEVSSRRDLQRFVKFPNQLYKGNPYFAPELLGDEISSLTPGKNPMLDQVEIKLFLALDQGKVVGRIGAILQHAYNEKTQQKRMRFTRFDFVDDMRVSAALMAAVEGFAREKGMNLLHGPMGCTDLDKQGMLIDGFEEFGLLLTYYNYPYYLQHLEALGFEKEVDWIEFHFKMPAQADPRIDRIAEAAKRRFGLTVPRYTSIKQIIPHIPELFEVINESYKQLYGVVPLSGAVAKHYVDHYLPVMSPDFIALAFDSNNKMIGFGIAAPNLTKALQKSGGRLFPFGAFHMLNALKNPEGLDLFYIGVLPEYQNKGVNAILMNEVIKGALRRGIKWAETGPQLELNDKVQSQFKAFEGRQHKRRRSFIKTLD